MALFHRPLPGGQPVQQGQPWTPPDDGDTPAGIRRELLELTRSVNRSAGRLPVDVVVQARRVCDVVESTLREDLDITARVALRGLVEDYLPTTISTYLAVDPADVDVPRPSGRTPAQSLREQLGDLERSSESVRSAVRDRDADALLTQGSFLRTKFARSDLEL